VTGSASPIKPDHRLCSLQTAGQEGREVPPGATAGNSFVPARQRRHTGRHGPLWGSSHESRGIARARRSPLVCIAAQTSTRRSVTL